MGEEPSVDVVVCTRNRSRLLPRACEAILAQDYPLQRWRLVVVDNASTDDTLEVATSVSRRFPGRMAVVQCLEPGHSASRNHGIRSGTSELVAFTDDDALPDPGWLRTLVDALTREGAQAAGGPVEAVLSGELPPWFLRAFLLYLAVWTRGEGIQRLSFNDYPRGVNLGFRRAAFDRCGLFSTHLGLRAGRPLYCEETELCLRIERLGGTILYSPRSVVGHEIDAGRLTVRWLADRFAAQGRSEAVLCWMHGGLRGLVAGSRVHRANATAVTADKIANGYAGGLIGPATPALLAESARILTRCHRRALRGYLRQAPLAIAGVPRYRGPKDAQLARFAP